MLDHARPPTGTACVSCGQPALLRLVAMHYPDQEVSGKQLEAFVAPSDPRPLPRTLDLCEFCWKSLYSLIAVNVYRGGIAEVENWEEWLRPYPPRVNVQQPDGTYRTSDSLLMEEYFRHELPPEEFVEYQRHEAQGFRRKTTRQKVRPPE